MIDDCFNIPFTIVNEIDKKSNNGDKQCTWIKSRAKKRIKIEVSNIKLKQAPQETLTMQVVIEGIKIDGGRLDCAYRVYHYNYRINMQFENYLHEFQHGYSYEIMCKIARKTLQHDYLFCCIESRLEGSLSTDESYLQLKYNLLQELEKSNLYFCIRRLNNHGSALVDNEKIHKVISALRKTGYDVILDAKDGRLAAHRSILSQNSDVFKTMFSAGIKDSKNGIINMLEFEARVVRKMLDYMYTRQLGELGDMTESLFKLAHRYQLHDLCCHCEEHYIFNVKVDNDSIVDVLKLSDLYELKNLNKYALNFVNRHEKELFALESFRKYLIQSLNLDNVVTRLVMADKHNATDFKVQIFDFIKDNYQQIIKDENFLELFLSNGQLMQTIHIYLHE